MIYLRFTIQLPIDRWGTIKSYTGKLPFNHKYWEFNVYKSSQLFSFNFEWKTRTDHAGIEFEFGLFGYSLEFMFYDDRHWDYKNNCYEN